MPEEPKKKPDFHMSEGEQVDAMTALMTLVVIGEHIFSHEEKFEQILDLLGNDAVVLAMAADNGHKFIDGFYAKRGLMPPVPPEAMGDLWKEN